ncbi:succinyl-diaminopimelate desuccinylase [Nakamurella leprariae]|uniref:Succinyl-diaminopimelate desuccinylase n=1 Tax=Nakamurella leprariae TaxID=2803911 RepID=A0A938YEB9_9ACTN|nr:succinyl-diaminopimelate desuccinylase [Nakamurella leprariae]
MTLDLTRDPADLTADLVDVPSVSGTEGPLADAVEAAVRAVGRFEMLRTGNTVLARTHLGRRSRVLLAGHLDTVPIADNVPSTRDGDRLAGCGTTDMKSGDAMLLHLAATVWADGREPSHDLTFVFYDCEEVEFARNGLTRVQAEHADWLAADLAVLAEPTGGQVEAGCQGTVSVAVTVPGRRAHAARAWMGRNAIHRAAVVLDRLAAHRPRSVDIDGCVYREGLNATAITAGVASNVLPDDCVIRVNHRFAPDRSVEQAVTALTEVLLPAGQPGDPSDEDDAEAPITVTVLDSAAGALPGLTAPAAARFVAAVRAAGGQVQAKYGWTDVSRFAALGIPAVNYGPGDPSLAHTRDEWVSREQIRTMTEVLRSFLMG